MAAKNKYKFKTDVKQLLDLVTHSLYSHKDVFLRELISNASDAIDKVRFESLTNPAVLEENNDWKIKLYPDKKKKTLTISDNGCGMTRDDLTAHIGTIAKSGTQEFLEKLKESKEKDNPDLIGQFGVGFYSSFMVADKVSIQTRTAGGEGCEWTSTGEAEFEIKDFAKATRGTDIVLHLKEDSQEFLEEHELRQLVKKYSEFVEFPICMDVEKFEYPEGKDGKKDYEAKPEKKIEEERLNSTEAIWLKPKSEVSKEDHKNFYKQISHDFADPLNTIHFTAEGALEYKALMYIPSKAPQDLYSRDAVKGLNLYINRVFIMNNCEKLLPVYLRFIKGVVDSSDLPLNVSRELLQENPQMEKIKKGLTNKILSTLKDMKKKDNEKYLAFYKEFGQVLKEGIHYDFENKDKIADLLYFETTKTKAGELKSFKEYIEGMQKEQKEIYYIIAENRTQALGSPQLELFRSKDMEVILMTDHVDEYIVPQLNEYDKKPLKAINKDKVNLEGEKEKAEEAKKKGEELGDLLKAIQAKLDDDVKEVKFSTRLTESACCLTAEEGGMNAQMEQMMKAMGQEVPKQKKILELNPSHPLIETLNGIFSNDKDSGQFAEYVELIFEQALLTEGSQLKDPLGFAKKVSELMVKAGKA
ncbi:MAG: molecular chaperone HtpG [bacterium]|nr:molecular chaperone HtpG [bacterium]